MSIKGWFGLHGQILWDKLIFFNNNFSWPGVIGIGWIWSSEISYPWTFATPQQLKYGPKNLRSFCIQRRLVQHFPGENKSLFSSIFMFHGLFYSIYWQDGPGTHMGKIWTTAILVNYSPQGRGSKMAALGQCLMNSIHFILLCVLILFSFIVKQHSNVVLRSTKMSWYCYFWLKIEIKRFSRLRNLLVCRKASCEVVL